MSDFTNKIQSKFRVSNLIKEHKKNDLNIKMNSNLKRFEVILE